MRANNLFVAQQFEVYPDRERLAHVSVPRHLGVRFDSCSIRFVFDWEKTNRGGRVLGQGLLIGAQELGRSILALGPISEARQGAVIPMVLLGAQCWVSVLCLSGLADLNLVLEAQPRWSLDSSFLRPWRCLRAASNGTHKVSLILWRFVRYLVQRQREH